MDNTDEHLHPNWLALATVHIPLKRFIKEGIEVQKVSQLPNKKYEISGSSGDEIRQFYDKLVTKGHKEQVKKLSKLTQNKLSNKSCKNQQHKTKASFDVQNYFRFAMENKVDELKKIDFEGQNLNVCDNYGWSALMIASCEGSYEAVDFLIALGVEKFIKDKTGRSAVDLAYRKGFLNIVELLEGHQREIKNNVLEEKVQQNEPFYCEICNQCFKETSKTQHYTSTIHLFNVKSNLPPNKLQKFNIPSRNKGLQLMLKQGWDKESGLGPSQSGRLYPIKTVMRKQRTGLGIEQEAACVTHFKAYDYKAVHRHSSDYYKKKPRSRNDIRREKVRDWKRDRRIRSELN